MVVHSQQHRRAASALYRRRADRGALFPRFSPTAIFSDQLTDTPTPTPAEPQPTPTPQTTPAQPQPPPADVTTTTTTPTVTTTPAATTDTTSTQPPSTTSTSTSASPPTDTNPATSPPLVNPVVNTTPVTTPLTRPTNVSTVVSMVSQPSRSVAPAETSSPAAPTSGSGSNVGGIIGGIAGGLLGLVVIIFIVRLILRRQSRKHDADDAAAFNSEEFQRSAVLISDAPTHADTVSGGFNPRPPSMIERRFASPAPTFGTQYGAPGPHHFDNGGYGATDQYGQYQSFMPGQLMNNTSPPPSANSANPLYLNPQAPYAQSPFSPIGSPTSSHYAAGYDNREEAGPYLTRQPSAGGQLNRQPSYGQDSPPQYANYPQVPPQTPGYPTSDYVDLDRSSVSPFQAAQYAEISKRLNTDVPAGLPTAAVAEFVHPNSPTMPPKAEVSPFADPATADAQIPQGRHSPNSTFQDPNYPAPPSPAYTNRSRIDSVPPSLPEIAVESRVSVTSYDFPNSVRGSGVPPSSGYPSGATAAGNGLNVQTNGQYPATPSPLASSFSVPTPPLGGSFETAHPHTAPSAPANVKRPETLYDAEDAYGGI